MRKIADAAETAQTSNAATTTALGRAKSPKLAKIIASQNTNTVTDVSSINTSRRACKDDCSAFSAARAAATSGRSCSAACSVFFERDAVPLVKSPNRGSADLQSFGRSEPCADLIECQIGFSGHQIEQPLLMRFERRATVSGAGLGCDATGCMPAIHPADSGRGRKIKQARGFSAALAALNQSHHAISQICRIALGHDRPRP